MHARRRNDVRMHVGRITESLYGPSALRGMERLTDMIEMLPIRSISKRHCRCVQLRVLLGSSGSRHQIGRHGFRF